jgi:FkbM family methyltransferase
VNCVLDVGANDGWYSKQLRMMGYGGNIVSFDPLRENCDRIVALAAGDPRWDVVKLALGATMETRDFNVIRMPGGSTELSSLLTPTESDEEWEDTIQVDVDRLDSAARDLLASIDHPSVFLKIDTQGYDVEVVRGAAGILDQVVALQSEVSVTPIYEGMPHYTEALAYYESLGFALVDLSVVTRTPEGIVCEYDALLIKQ